MELRHLRYFVAAAEAENVSQAAVKLHVSQPALSRQIRDLEEELGFPLFERSARSVHLTEAGRTFLTEARAVLHRTEEAIARSRAVAKGSRIDLHVGYAPSPTARIMPAALREFQSRFPKVRVRLHDLSTDEMVIGVRAARLELAFLVRPSPSMLRGLHFEELARDPMRLAVPPQHAWARRRSLPLKNAAEQPLVVFGRKDYPEYLEYLVDLFARVGAKPGVAEEHDSSASLIAAIESGAGLAIVPESFACSAGPRLKLIPIVPAPEPIIVGAVWAKEGLTPAAQGFLDSARRVAAASQSG